MKLYRMYAIVPHTRGDWSGLRQTPTFYIPAMNEKHARDVGEEVIRAAIGPGDKVFTMSVSEDFVTVDQLVTSQQSE